MKAKKRMDVHVCILSDKFVTVRYNNRDYNFEHTAWAGWVPTTLNHSGAKKNHPLGAWRELKRLHDPEIIVE